MPPAAFARVVELCAEREVVLFSDEVYRGLEHDPASRLPAACDVLRRGISLGTVSKAYGLPGLRLGWLATRDAELRDAIRALKLYTTICSSAPSELLVAVAVRHHATLIEECRAVVARGLPHVDGLLERHSDILGWRRPDAGPIGFPRWSQTTETRPLCERAVAECGVLLLPGDVYGEPSHVRVGFGRATTREAVERLDAWLTAG